MSYPDNGGGGGGGYDDNDDEWPVNYSRSQNCWDVFVSSSPLNVGVHDLPTESQ